MMKFKPVALAALALLSALPLASQAQSRKTYIVQLKDEPAITYKGGTASLDATAPAAGEGYQAQRPEVLAYVAHLETLQQAVAAKVADAPVLARYSHVFNGFAASLTEDEARVLSNDAGVAGLWEDEMRHVDTISTAKFLKLSEPGGLWSQSIAGSALKGENLVIGVIDTGVWPENPAFADRVDDKGVPTFDPAATQVYGSKPAGFKGICQVGEGTSAAHCNNKLIGLRYFNAGLLNAGVALHWSEFNSGRDSLAVHGGHGDHTASTAAGNAGATAIVGGVALGQATGMAPRARIAAYKVCWTYDNPSAADGTGSANGCLNSDSVAAIDAAVADGVNVINFSISGSQTTVNDPVEQAFYRAALAGVFVAASAGNSGPANTVAHISPWVTTVGASTHDRAFQADLVLGSGARFSGASLAANVLPARTPLINASVAGLPGADANALKLCFDAASNAGVSVLDPAKVAGKIVVCTRGTNPRVAKSAAVLAAGGIGMVLVDNDGGLVAEPHSVPTVHVSAADGAAISAYADGAGAHAALSKFYFGSVPAPKMIGFSSRGPNLGDGNILKPDLTAPGVDIVAQATPTLTQTERNQVAAGTLVPPPAWTLMSGTSMSSPHVAGLALLLKQAHPGWSPAAIKSALMTSGYSTLDDGLAGLANGLLPWAQGAGHVDPQKANDPGLVYNAGKNDWVKYMCKISPAAVSPASDCTTIGKLNETYELNLPSITVGNLLGTTTVPRSVTNVGSSMATYTASASLPGFNVVVTPSSLTLAPNATATFTVKLTPAGATEGSWSYGQLVWSDGTHSVRAPMQAKLGKPIVAPAEATGSTAVGSRLLSVKTGFAGRMGVKKGGMKEATVAPAVTLAPDDSLEPEAVLALCRAGQDTAAVKVHSFSVPAGAIVARWALRTADVGDANDDNDLYVLDPNGGLVGQSTGSSSQEAVQLAAPPAGSYKACVHAFGGAPAMSHALSSWIVRPGDGAGLNAMVPSTVYVNSNATVGMSWSGLASGKRYVGGIQLLDVSGTPQATTVLRISTDGSVPVQNEPASPAKARRATH